jgi:hypothetical protein
MKENYMKALTYLFNGNRCLTFLDDSEIKEMRNEFTDINMRDMINRHIFFTQTGMPATYKNFERDNLELKISRIREFDYTDCIFPTSQPRIGLTYLEHPIKNNVFIPMDIYDKYIHEEKKGELIDMLKNLGVKRITFSISQENKDQDIQKIFEYVIKNELIDISKEEEIWEFDNSKIDISIFNDAEYTWLSTEPGWKRIVKSLKSGGVRIGTISFSDDISALSLVEFQRLLQGRKSVRIKIYKIQLEA